MRGGIRRGEGGKEGRMRYILGLRLLGLRLD